ncbi:hypothetical protein JB92DRAFT_2831343 [Gautieria morchelliformis]|nr:hypothetical protein JB92DRAFT_2831343 [Gautieria morchelliformis]
MAREAFLSLMASASQFNIITVQPRKLSLMQRCILLCASLQTEVIATLVMKRHEDAGQAEVKAWTKVEKKLKAATAVWDGASGGIEWLRREVKALQRWMADSSMQVIVPPQPG